jgi:hypothetical protein
MPFSIRPYQRFPVQCAMTYNAGLLLKLPRAYFLGFGVTGQNRNSRSSLVYRSRSATSSIKDVTYSLHDTHFYAGMGKLA